MSHKISNLLPFPGHEGYLQKFKKSPLTFRQIIHSVCEKHVSSREFLNNNIAFPLCKQESLLIKCSV